MDAVRIAGWAGLLGALLVGVAEFWLHFSPNGGIDDVKDYLYFNDVSPARLSRGHFLAILSAPLYILGYWFLSKQLEPAHKRASQLFFLIGAYAFVVGTAWIGQRAFLGMTVHEISSGSNIKSLLRMFSEHNEPFVNILRLAMFAVSIIWIALILTGRSRFPKWMAFFSPLLLLASMFALYFFKTSIGLYVFPIAMNAAHVIVFALALWSTRYVGRHATP